MVVGDYRTLKRLERSLQYGVFKSVDVVISHHVDFLLNESTWKS